MSDVPIVAPVGVDDRLAVDAFLPDPHAGRGRWRRRRTACASIRSAWCFIAGHRIVERATTTPIDEDDDERRRDELPYRNAGGARHDQFQFAREIEERDHRAEQHGEGQRLLGDGRGMQERNPGHQQAGRSGRVAGAAQHFDEIDRVNEGEDAREDREDRPEEAPGEVTPERAADHRASPAKARRRIRRAARLSGPREDRVDAEPPKRRAESPRRKSRRSAC